MHVNPITGTKRLPISILCFTVLSQLFTKALHHSRWLFDKTLIPHHAACRAYSSSLHHIRGAAFQQSPPQELLLPAEHIFKQSPHQHMALPSTAVDKARLWKVAGIHSCMNLFIAINLRHGFIIMWRLVASMQIDFFYALITFLMSVPPAKKPFKLGHKQWWLLCYSCIQLIFFPSCVS